MTLKYFKDKVFDMINESDDLDIIDIFTRDKDNTFIIMVKGGFFTIKFSQCLEMPDVNSQNC
ncbi:MAG: hypothetical protein IJ370_01610 [Oscillospiraceae bacterium]|nr:hypothetical protein [Oscillospiraceae bacterium]